MQLKIDKDPDSFYKAEDYFDNWNYEAAKKIFHKRVTQLPNAENYYWYAKTQGELENYPCAIEYYNKAAAAYVAHSADYNNQSVNYKSQAYYEIARIYNLLNNRQEAEYNILEAIKHDPENENYYEFYGDFLSEYDYAGAMNQYNTAIIHCEKGDKGYFYIKMANLAKKNRYFAEALTQYEMAIAHEYSSKECHYECALIHQKMGNLEKANQHFEAAIKLQQITVQYFQTKERNPVRIVDEQAQLIFYSYQQAPKQKRDWAVRELNRLLNKKSSLAHYYFAALIHAETRDYNALVHYCKAIELNPFLQDAYNGLYEFLTTKPAQCPSNFKFPSNFIKIIQEFPQSAKRIALAKMLLDDNVEVGRVFINRATTIDSIYALIQLIPVEPVNERMVYLEKACTKGNRLYVAEYLGFTLKAMQTELAGYKTKALILSAEGQGHDDVILEKLIGSLDKEFISGDYVFDPEKISQIIKQFNKTANAAPASSPLRNKYGAFICKCNADYLLKLIVHDEMLVNRNEFLLDCLDKNTILGNKFLIQKPDKYKLRDCILALSEYTPEALLAKKVILEKVLNKHQDFVTLFWTPHHPGATVSVKTGTLLIFAQELSRIEKKLAEKTIKNDSFMGFDLIDSESDGDLTNSLLS